VCLRGDHIALYLVKLVEMLSVSAKADVEHAGLGKLPAFGAKAALESFHANGYRFVKCREENQCAWEQSPLWPSSAA
jgi:hypothetical protein